jgi:hypothetical protein
MALLDLYKDGLASRDVNIPLLQSDSITVAMAMAYDSISPERP